MRFEVEHLTTYHYSEPVTLGPQTVRLRPRPDGSFRELEYGLEVSPTPTRRCERLDAAGNRVTRLWLEGPVEELSILSRFTAETDDATAFEPVLDPDCRRLPMVYARDEAACLQPYLGSGAVDPAVAGLVAELAGGCDPDPLGFLARLNQWLHQEVEREIRHQGAAQSPVETLLQRRGACRDQTVLFVTAARALGLAARFVSGYQDRSAVETSERHLHAWPEVYLPGWGWSGFDPTRGVPVTSGHVPVAAAALPAEAMPVEGCYFGKATSSLEFRLEILTNPAPVAATEDTSSL